MTLEEAQAEIVRLNEELTERTNERDSLSHENNVLFEDNERLRKLNQNYFNKLSAQFDAKDDKKQDDEKECPTCEEFAKTIII
mgnify:CR=1 FL=1